ncbi:MAG: hypothetical protein A4S12_08025 [Proteobacteria bacterium SG_bin5]|nr:pyridoxamine 5'-phosphate oxidase family protein [Sphingomonas sp.]OQW41522.1 MAG: hypothetical protein A4S12_08025 [Proteobacteria bacterium SG_bin5]
MSGPPRPAFTDDLGAALAEAERLLRRAVVDRHSPWRTLQLASIATDGAPDVRTLVLRGVDARARRLRLHTDRRSAKIAELTADPRVMLHGYDPRAKLQLRLAGRATVLTGDDSRAAWLASSRQARACYAISPAPGTVVETPPPAPELTPGAHENFAVLIVQYHSLDWLWLSAEGHRRARFDWVDETLEARWLVP